MKIDLTWGESVAVREQFINLINPFVMIAQNRDSLLSLNYSPFEGDTILLEHTKKVIQRQFGRTYKHVILVNGAAGGCVITMRAYAQSGKSIGLTAEAPFFSLYPSMVNAAGLEHQTKFEGLERFSIVSLIDSPSNPTGEIRVDPLPFAPVIWDAAYGNKVYTRLNPAITHDVLVGSYSKLTGLNGIRIGWIATDDSILFERIKDLVAAEYCGLSTPSSELLNKVLPDFDWASFERNSIYALDRSREEWSRLERFFGGHPTPDNGMFYYAPMDKKCQEIFTKAEVVWTPGSKLGHNDSFGRFNIGQSLSNIKNAVAQVLKADKLP